MKQTYRVLFEGGPLDGREEHRLIKGKQKNPEFINKPWNEKIGAGTNFRQHDCYYIAYERTVPTPSCTLIYKHAANWRPVNATQRTLT